MTTTTKTIHQWDGRDCLKRNEKTFKPCVDFYQNISRRKGHFKSNIEGSSCAGHDTLTPTILCCWGSHSVSLPDKGTSHMP